MEMFLFLFYFDKMIWDLGVLTKIDYYFSRLFNSETTSLFIYSNIQS